MKDLFPVEIDENLGLRLLEERHALELFQLVDSSRSHLRRWLPFVDSYHSVSAAISFIRRFQESLSKKEGLALGIWFKEKLAGVATYDHIDWENRATLIGYWLGESFQGMGLMTRSCKALVNIAFDKLRLNRVEVGCASENTRCRAVPQRLGFKQEGVHRQREWVYDHFVDITVYSMLASEWKRK